MILFRILLMTFLPLAGIAPQPSAAVSAYPLPDRDLVDTYRQVLDLDEPQTHLVGRILQLAQAGKAAGQAAAANKMERAITAILSPRQQELFRRYLNQMPEKHVQ